MKQATNAYYGCYLYGLATANVELTQFSLVLLSMEIQGARLYWHMPNANVYDSFFTGNVMVGNVGALDVTASTWFGNEPEYVHGINMMPLTPISSALFNQEFVIVEWPVVGYRLETLLAQTGPKSTLCSRNTGLPYPISYALSYILYPILCPISYPISYAEIYLNQHFNISILLFRMCESHWFVLPGYYGCDVGLLRSVAGHYK